MATAQDSSCPRGALRLLHGFDGVKRLHPGLTLPPTIAGLRRRVHHAAPPFALL